MGLDLMVRGYRSARLGYGRLRHARGWTGVRILGYHRVSTDSHDISVHPTSFRRQMEEIARRGMNVLPLEEALDLLAAGPVQGQHLCLTFDDGYRDNLENAAPCLEELGFPATIFVPTAIIDGELSFFWFADPPPALSWDELATLLAGGLVDVQPHSRTHPWLPSLADDAAEREIAGAKDDLEARLGSRGTSFCFPAGLYGERELRLVREAGYLAGVTTDPGVNQGAASLPRLRRTLVFQDTSHREFCAKLDGFLDHPSLKYRRNQWLRRVQAAPGYQPVSETLQ